MEMIADRVLDARRKGWQDADAHGAPLRRTQGIASLGGATLDNEENYLMKKLYTAWAPSRSRTRPHMTLLHRPRSGDLVRSRRRHHLPAGPRRR